MNPRRCYFLLVNLLALPVAVAAQQFPCDGSFILTLYDFYNSPTDIHQIYYDGNEVQFNDLTSVPLAFNSTGFNPLDNFLYGTPPQSNRIVRIKADGSYEVVGTEPEILSWKGGAGDCNKNGIYVVQSRENFKLYFYEVTNVLSKVASLELIWDPSTGNTGLARIYLDDVVFDPEDQGILYTYQRNYDNLMGEPAPTRGALLKIDADPDSPDFGTVSVVGFVPQDVILHIGSLFFNVKGELYGYGSIETDPLRQNRLVKINKTTGEAELIGIGPEARNSDGCSCPFSLALEKRVEVLEKGCDSIRVEFTFDIINRSGVEISDADFEERLPGEWMITWIEPNQPIGSDIVDGTGIGTSTLLFENGLIPPDTTIHFTIRVALPALPGTFSNQAFLHLNGPLFGDRIPSEDPATDVQEDETTFTIDDLPENAQDTVEAGICPGRTYEWNGEVYTSAGTYEQILPGQMEDCDTIHTLILTEREAIPDSLSAVICRGVSFTWRGQTYAEEGIYTQRISAETDGCDTLAVLELEVLDESVFTFREVLCEGIPFSLNGETYGTPGTYTQLIENGAASGCDSLIRIELLAEENLQLDYPAQVRVLPGAPASISVVPGFAADSVAWSPAAGLSCGDCLTPTVTVEEERTYTVTVFNERGCSVSGTIQVLLGEACRYYFPNAFSPGNEDGANDVFTVYGSPEVEEVLRLEIFDRWGNQVFSRQNFAPGDESLGWDGTFRGRDMPAGLYTFHAEIRCEEGVFLEKGGINLLR